MGEQTMTIDDWNRAEPRNNITKETDWPFEARRSAVVYGGSAAILACNYGVSAAEARQLMNDAFDHELNRRSQLGMKFEP